MKNPIIRKCRSCNESKDRALMIKITLNNNNLYINPDSKTFGRSVYVCKNIECIKTLIKKKGIKKGLKFNDDNKIKEIEKILLSCEAE